MAGQTGNRVLETGPSFWKEAAARGQILASGTRVARGVQPSLEKGQRAGGAWLASALGSSSKASQVDHGT